MIRNLIAVLGLPLVLAGVQTWRIDRVKHDLTLSREQVKALAARLDVADRDAQTQATQCDAREANARQPPRPSNASSRGLSMSIPKAALFASLFLLTSCGTLFSRAPAAKPLSPSLCTEVRHASPMPAGASVVQPVTEAEKDAFRLFMTWVAESLSIGEQRREGRGG
ncbi:hypothetical protein IFJ75_14435 [Brevundimonas goettingensis]|uniref:Uncharacterized protein n=2 Tax=Brevundimonas goettingensis TaxID=2774190 RepID=A0A975C059_9CAUL|nr:hypothetical protein IFJ75_14435 [Brevundimonas goettingensis]